MLALNQYSNFEAIAKANHLDEEEARRLEDNYINELIAKSDGEEAILKNKTGDFFKLI